MKTMRILQGLISATVLMSGCSHQMDPERDQRAASRAYDDNDADAIPPSGTNARVLPRETYCDTEYMRMHPDEDCADYDFNDVDETLSGR